MRERENEKFRRDGENKPVSEETIWPQQLIFVLFHILLYFPLYLCRRLSFQFAKLYSDPVSGLYSLTGARCHKIWPLKFIYRINTQISQMTNVKQLIEA